MSENSNEAEVILRDYIAEQLAGGFESADDIAIAAMEVNDEFDAAVSGPIVERLVPELMRAKIAQEAAWPAVTDCDRLDAAFDALTRSGIVSRQNFTCCQTCGHAEIGGEIEQEEANGLVPRGYAFYHQQDTESAVVGRGLCIAYGALEAGDASSVAVGREIVAALSQQGLACSWNGLIDQRISVALTWQRRLPRGIAEN